MGMRAGLDQIPDEKARAVVAELKQRLRELYGDRLVSVILYGSRARGDHGPDSDVDVAVVLRGEVNKRRERERTIEVVSDISLENDAVLHRVFLAEDEFTRADQPLVPGLRQEGVVV